MKQRSEIAGDLWGGLAAMLVALPAAIAYGIASYGALGPDLVGTGVRAGLLGAALVGLVTAAIGGAPRLISAPSAPAAAILGALAVTLAAGTGQDPHSGIVLLGVAALLAGALQVVFGAVGGGRLIKFIPYPVVSGYLSAVAVIILKGQLPGCAGVSVAVPAQEWIGQPALWRWPAIVVSTATIVFLLVGPRLTKRVPATIIGLLGGTGTYLLLGFASPGLWTLAGNPFVLGNLTEAGILDPAPIRHLWNAALTLGMNDLSRVLVPALTLGVLLSVDTLKTCVIVDSLTHTRHDSNRTLLAQGAANVFSAVLGGMPGSGTMGPTLVNVQSGARTRLSGAAAAALVIIAVIMLGRWIAWIPTAALSGILVVVAVRMFDWNCLNLLRQRSTVLDFAVIATVVVTAVATNLVVAAGAGVALAMVIFIRDQVRGSVLRRKARGNLISSKQHRLAAENAVLDHSRQQILVCELQGSLFFGTTDQLWRELERDVKTCRFLVLDLRRVISLDYTATHLFTQFEALLRERGGFLLFSRVPARPELRDYLSAHQAVNVHPNARTFETLDDAIQWAEDRIVAEKLPAAHQELTPLMLREFELAKGVDDGAALDALSSSVYERSIAAGETVFKAGDPSDELFLIRRGVVRVTLPLNGSGYHTLATFGRGHFFGEMAFLVRGPRSANAVATTDTDVYVISRTAFDRVAKEHPSLGLKVFSQLAHVLAVRLRRADAELRAFYET